MTITANDIKLLESERMSDTTDGGGRRTARVIPDGADIFPKVSRLDAVYGRVNLRKVYGAVTTANVDTYAGAHAIVTDPPDNNRISVCLFSTRSDFDTRAEARDRIESYVVAGPESRMWLYGQQPLGAKAVLVYQRTEEPLPEIGDVHALTQEDNAGNIIATQYIRVDSLEHEVRRFEDERGIYEFRVITIGITAPLIYSFRGTDTPVRVSSSTARLGRVRITSVADAARYFGVQPLAEAAGNGALSVRVPSIYSAIVPTSQRETAISLAEISGATVYTAAGASFFEARIISYSQVYTYTYPGPVQPGSVFITAKNGGAAPADGYHPITDDGDGNLISLSGQTVGTVDYAAGQTVHDLRVINSAWFEWSADHGVGTSSPAHTTDVPITLANRGSVYTQNLSPIAAPGTLIVDYRALGKWYRLRDQGDGTLRGNDNAYGTGTVDYITGAVVVTLGALPDVGSALIFGWGSPIHYTQRVGAAATADTRCRQTIQLANVPVDSNSVSLTFRYGAADVVLPLNAGNTGSNANVQASVDTTSGLVSIRYIGNLPDPGSSITVGYNQRTATGGSPEPALVSVNIDVVSTTTSLSVGRAIAPGSANVYIAMDGRLAPVSGAWTTDEWFSNVSVRLIDDGAGNLRVAPGQALSSSIISGARPGRCRIEDNAIIGTINYSAGTLGINNTLPIAGELYQTPLGLRPGAWVAATGTASRRETGTAQVRFAPAGAVTVNTSQSEAFGFDVAPLRIDLTTSTPDAIVPGSVMFRIWSGNTAVNTAVNQYMDRNGVILRDINTATNTGTVCGSIDYESGEVTVSDWYSSNQGADIVVQSCLTGRGEFVADSASFRTAGSPVRPGSFYVQASLAGGGQVSASSDVSGNISGAGISAEGTIAQDMGVVSLRFGQWQPVAGNTGEPWYDPELVDPNDTTRVWKPARILPSTLRYSCVVSSNIALDSNILGLDPVRLPLDGRVPIFRPGDVAVVHNTQSLALPNPVTAGATYSAGRGNLSDAWLVSAANLRINPALYTVDLAAGTVTLAAPLDLAGIPQPLTLKHRVEDMLLLSDVRIDGTLESAAPLSRAYPTSGTYVSSALLFGDLAARVSNLFDQATWLGTWQDQVAGGGATGQYNDVLYPVEVTNTGAITERWRLNFTSTTAFQVIGENSGVIATGTTSADCGPINPLTLEPYFVLRSGGWGAGWAVGNQLRFNTLGCSAPIWMARTILPGASLAGDSIDLQMRGDVDA